ncbi:MAG: hypothetical protein PVI21_02170 [Candidatus Woesebacteria bacterium]|jgi:hypothetical protein
MAKQADVEQIVLQILRSYYIRPTRNPFDIALLRAVAIVGNFAMPFMGSLVSKGLEIIHSEEGKFYPNPSMIPQKARARIRSVYRLDPGERILGLYNDNPWLPLARNFYVGTIAFTTKGLRCAPGICVAYEQFATAAITAQEEYQPTPAGIGSMHTIISMSVNGKTYPLGEDQNSKLAVLGSLQSSLKRKKTKRRWWRRA